MSLHPLSAHSIPEETQRVAHAAFPKGTLCLRIADELGTLYRDDQFAELFPKWGQPAASPARIAMASVLQYVEGLSDRQAADAVRGRIDWKYALGLELTDPRLRPHRAQRVPLPPGEWPGRTAAPRHPPGTMPRT